MALRRQTSPLSIITTLPNLVAARYSQATLRLQGRAHPVRPVFDEIFLPLDERAEAVSNALKGLSPAYISVTQLVMIARNGLNGAFFGLSSALAKNHPIFTPVLADAMTTAFFHPWSARLAHLQAIPPPLPWTSPFPNGVISTLKEQRFYVRSLEPAILRNVAHGLIHRSRMVERLVQKWFPDPESKADWDQIETALIEEDTVEPGTLDEEAIHRRLQALYSQRFHRWFMRTLTRTLIEDYVVRTVLFPIETVTVRLACNSPTEEASPFFVANAWKIFSNEGLSALYSGLSVTLSAVIPHLVCAWGLYFGGRLVIALVDPALVSRLLAFAPQTAAQQQAQEEDSDDDAVLPLAPAPEQPAAPAQPKQ